MTLVEVLVSMVLMLFVSLAMMQTALVSIQSNMKGEARDMAVGVADKWMSEVRNQSFAAFAAGLPGAPAVTVNNDPRYVRNVSINYRVTRSVTTLDSPEDSVRQVNVKVEWAWKGEPFSHNVTTMVRR